VRAPSLAQIKYGSRLWLPKSDLILQVAHQTAADLTVLAVPATHRFSDRFVSTNSYRVVCGARCPVLTVHAQDLLTTVVLRDMPRICNFVIWLAAIWRPGSHCGSSFGLPIAP
jgi:hypothetical protein